MDLGEPPPSWAIVKLSVKVKRMRAGETAPETPRHDERQRVSRRNEALYRRRRVRLAIAFGVLCLAVAGILIGLLAGHSTAQVSGSQSLVNNTQASSAPVSGTGEQHPAFARLGDRNLLLPVAAQDATIIAYQPVADERAVALSPLGGQENTGALARFFRRVFSGTPSVRYYVLPGQGNVAMGSADIGAQPGTAIASPVSGTVSGVKSYKLYGKYDDVQIDIQPELSSGLTISLLLISDPVVSIGEVVTAGKTQLGKVRACPVEIGQRLAKYTHDTGAHVHLQVTQEPID